MALRGTLLDDARSYSSHLKLLCEDQIRWKFIRISRKSSSIEKRLRPLVSVLLPTYNRVKYLMERSIPSILSQTESDFELLVVSHGCTDSTHEYVHQVNTTDKRVKLIRCYRDAQNLGYPPTAENHWLAGPVKPINAGLRAAQGKWIARIDDDDEWSRDHLEVLLSLAQKTRADFVSAAYRVSDIRGQRDIMPAGVPPIGGVQTWLYRSELSVIRANIDCWRKSWNRVNDSDLEDRFRKLKLRIASTDRVIAFLHPREGEQYVGSAAYLNNPKKYRDIYG